MLDEVRLVPTAQAPHRRDSSIAPQRRLDWLRKAIAPCKGLVADDRELHRSGPSFTADTLDSLRAEFPDASLVLLMGADAFAHLHRWHRWQELITLAHLAVVSRPGAIAQPSAEAASLLSGRRAEASALSQQPAGLWTSLDLPLLDISSTRIRRLLKAGQSVRGLVPDTILNAMTPADIAALSRDDVVTTH